MSKAFFTRQVRTLLLVTTVAAVFTSRAWAQVVDTTHYAVVPFLVNVDATVVADPPPRLVKSSSDSWLYDCFLYEKKKITVTANQVAIMLLPLGCGGSGVLYGAQRQTTVPEIVSNLGGKVTVNLAAQSYKNAEISLYTVNGKRILRNKVSASSAVNSISRPNIANGVYLLSVKGTGGYAVTSRLTHGGGGLNINVVFGNGSETLSTVSQMAKKAYELPWTILVSTTIAGYINNTYILTPIVGTNPQQNITLRFVAGGEESYESVEIGGTQWMAKNLNRVTAESWCYGNSADSCAKYGRLYTWTAAKTACPDGWKLPDTADWRRLVDVAGDSSTAGKALKSESGWYNNGNGTDDFGFSALPGGGGSTTDGIFSVASYGASNYGYWWTATEYNSYYAYRRGMSYNDDHVLEDYTSKGGNASSSSVRCIMDERELDE